MTDPTVRAPWEAPAVTHINLSRQTQSGTVSLVSEGSTFFSVSGSTTPAAPLS